MRLAFDDRLIKTNHFDGEMSMLADRHYSRRTVGARQFLYSGRKLVLRNGKLHISKAGQWLFVKLYHGAGDSVGGSQE